MKTYNRYQHCNQKLYTGRGVTEIVCSECGEQISFDDIIKTDEAISKQDEVTPVKVFESEEELE